MRDHSTCQRCGIEFAHQRNTVRNYCSKACRYAEPPLTLEARFWPKVNREGPIPEQHPEFGSCWDWSGSRRIRTDGSISYGYLKSRLAPDILAHRAAWIVASGGEIPEGMEIGHTCDRAACCRNDSVGVYVVGGVEYERRGHLWLATHQANMADCATKQRMGLQVHPETTRPGELSPVAKLTEFAVREILTRYAARTHNQEQLAAEFGVNASAISMIVRGKRWASVAPEIPRIATRQRVDRR